MNRTRIFSVASIIALVACSSFGDKQDEQQQPPTPPGETPKAPPIGGTPSSSDLVEALGVFVTQGGSTTPDGTRQKPFGTIQAGIDAAKLAGKRVYVCAGSYAESLTLADSISVIGGLDCSTLEWKPGSSDARSKVTAPKSPAITARQITSPTRVAALEVVAPNATEPSGSSIGLFAEGSSGLTIASSSLRAGDGVKGNDGVDGIQLTQVGTLDGIPSKAAAVCPPMVGNCSKVPGPGPATSICQGAPGHDGEAGGVGSSGGSWKGINISGAVIWGRVVDPESGGPGTSAVGAAGKDGAPPAAVGALDAKGYVPADGNAGTDGEPGKGGAGGAGDYPPFPATLDVSYRGESGAAGGAGGCPGLAGEPGKGGGASIAIALIQSPIVLEDVKAIAGVGGAAGLGALGSTPRRGGAPAGGSTPGRASQNGGNGGNAGTSSNGSAGPSFGIAHVGPAPTLKGASKAEPGKGGAGVPERVKTANGVGTPTKIVSTPDGLTEAIHAF